VANLRALLLAFILGAAIGSGSIYFAGFVASGSPGAKLADAQRHSRAALSALDRAIQGSGRIEELARGIQECAIELSAIAR
jgi:hypothetical protein